MLSLGDRAGPHVHRALTSRLLPTPRCPESARPREVDHVCDVLCWRGGSGRGGTASLRESGHPCPSAFIEGTQRFETDEGPVQRRHPWFSLGLSFRLCQMGVTSPLGQLPWGPSEDQMDKMYERKPKKHRAQKDQNASFGPVSLLPGCIFSAAWCPAHSRRSEMSC